jgi:hypothetical protein
VIFANGVAKFLHLDARYRPDRRPTFETGSIKLDHSAVYQPFCKDTLRFVTRQESMAAINALHIRQAIALSALRA